MANRNNEVATLCGTASYPLLVEHCGHSPLRRYPAREYWELALPITVISRLGTARETLEQAILDGKKWLNEAKRHRR